MGTWAALAAPFLEQQHVTMELISTGETPPNFFALNINPLLDRDSKVRGRVFTLRDVTERVEAEEQLRKRSTDLEQLNRALEVARATAEEARDQAQRADQIKSQFLASMSHELRTPLNAILNFTEFVSLGMMGAVNERQKDALEKSLDSARHLLNLINDVLDIAKIESGMMHLFVEDNVDLTSELRPVIAATQTLIKDKAVTLIQDIDVDLPSIVGDKRRIRQIMLNLLSNAAKFTEQGSITLSAKRRDADIMFAVCDTGPGIAPEDHNLIFEPFQQTDHGIQHMNGTGLGLPITKCLVEAHGGNFWLESQVGEGAAFFVTLPIRSAALLEQLDKVSQEKA